MVDQTSPPQVKPEQRTPSTAAQDFSADMTAEEHAAAGQRFLLQSDYGASLHRFWMAVRLRPEHAPYHCMLAHAAWQAGVSHLVERHFLEALRLDPNCAAAHDGLGQWALELGQISRAMAHTATAIELDPENAEFQTSRANALASSGKIEQAWAIVEPLLAAAPRSGRLAILYAQIAGRLEQERQALQRIEAALQSADLPPAIRPQFEFLAAGLLDRLGRYDEAFEHARLANRTSARQHDPLSHARRVQDLIDFFTPRRTRSLPRATRDTRRAVLIVGMPRSGTTLIEQILATHPRVRGAGELTTLDRIAQGLPSADWSGGEAYPASLERLSIRAANELADQYLAELDPIDRSAAYVIDKMPHNFLHLGLAQTVLPDCRVIHCTRNPLDTCLSCFFTHFAQGNEFSYDLGHVGSFYRQYRRLVEHWQRVLQLPMLEVRYEEVIADVEGQSRRLVQFLDLDWEPRCLEFHKNPRPVATASRDQVRQPIYATSVGRWKNYERHLSGLRAALAAV